MTGSNTKGLEKTESSEKDHNRRNEDHKCRNEDNEYRQERNAKKKLGRTTTLAKLVD